MLRWPAACGRIGFDAPGSDSGDDGAGDGGVGSGSGTGTPIAAPRAVTVSPSSSCAILDDRSLWCWGWDLGVLGVDAAQRIAPPARIDSDADWLTVVDDIQRRCAIKLDGSLWCADCGALTQLTRISTASDWTAIDAHQGVACGLRGDGQGELGAGDTRPRAAFTQRTNLTATSNYGLGELDGTTCARDVDDRAWCWDDNASGLLGGGAAWSTSYRSALRPLP